MATPTALHLTIHGRVQGVGYRSWATGNARERGLTGWVRNSTDGTVEMLICGDSAAVADMHEACKKGPLAANVIRIAADVWDNDIPRDFRQLPTA